MWAAPGLEWFRIGENLFGFRGLINGAHHCIIGHDRRELGSLSYAIWTDRKVGAGKGARIRKAEALAKRNGRLAGQSAH